MNLDGRRILITGGGSGIGLALARRLAPGNQVAIAGRDEAKLASAARSAPSLTAFRLDVTDEAEARSVMEEVATAFGGLDLLVNNAGLLRGYLPSAPDAAANAEADVNVNLLGAIRLTRLALPLVQRSDEGGVVFVSSAAALAAAPGFAVYAATKAGVHAYARSLRLELAGSGIHVFEVLPPVVDTGPMQDVDVPKLSPEQVATAIVAGLRRGREEIRIGAVRPLSLIARLMPRVADRLVTKALGQAPR